ncbi:MAG: PD-(D/E)XK nuclease family protein [Proteobacteria bacterium]|nr:PD-(D/E)XK nuclease family protein [Pseudomonadota bacterium]
MSTREPMDQTLTLSVGELAEFGRGGDINFRFSGRSTAGEGVRGHQLVQQSRGPGYDAERSLMLLVDFGDHQVRVQGRADGVDQTSSPVTVDEIKTLRVPPEALPRDVRAVHWAQLSIYGHLLAVETGAPSIRLRLCYFDLTDETEAQFACEVSAQDLKSHFDRILGAYVGQIEATHRWHLQRNASIDGRAFPYGGFRPGQRDLSVAVYRHIAAGQQLVLQAPTGVGKTMGMLFPAIKAFVSGGCEQIFYISARTSGQLAAESALADLEQEGARLRSVTLTARDKTCFNPGTPCHPDHCSYARGYFDRRRGAVSTLLGVRTRLGRREIEDAAREFHVCPFEFALDLATEADVIVCDYNYVFDPAAHLHRFFDRDADSRYVLLVDESHNLVDRGREMFSAGLDKQSFMGGHRRFSNPGLASVVKALAGVNRQFLALQHGSGSSVSRLEAPPKGLIRSLKVLVEHLEAGLRDQPDGVQRDELLQLYFRCLSFLRTTERFGPNFACIVERDQRSVIARLLCLDPGPLLRLTLRKMRSTVCFSATLRPRAYFEPLLGVEESATWYLLPSPFPAEHLGVFIASHIDTDYRRRFDDLPALVRLIIDTVESRQGNYLVFFPSYAYLDAVHDVMGQVPFELRRQTRGMTDPEQRRFLADFQHNGSSSVVGFAVMGGAFAEGIDLKGNRLIGAIVVGVGLPRIGIERDLIRDHFGPRGFEFAYQYPGMNRVLQTAGRVIRDELDQGVIVLADSRFAQPRYRAQLPEHWRVEPIARHDTLMDKIGQFWQSLDQSQHKSQDKSQDKSQ